jgi:hypothetical protein
VKIAIENLENKFDNFIKMFIQNKIDIVRLVVQEIRRQRENFEEDLITEQIYDANSRNL